MGTALSRHCLHVEVFADVPFPGHPLAIAAERANGTVYVATHRQATGEPNVPSHVYAYNRFGELVRDYPIAGQNESGQGISGIALDHDGILYLTDQAPSRVITLDPRTGEQEVYAELPDVPLCAAGGEPGHCSDGATDRPAQPINSVFGPDGSLYIGDLTQALVWRVPAGGGAAEVWYTASDLDSLFGANTLRFRDHGRTLILGDSAHQLQDPAELPNARGRLYTLAVNRDGTAGRRELLWEGEPGETPDGFAIGQSGNIYVTLAVANTVAVLDPDGVEITRVPLTAEDNEERDVPFDLPGSAAFYGDRLLVTNHVFFGGPQERQVVFSIDVHERGKRLFRPRIRRGGC